MRCEAKLFIVFIDDRYTNWMQAFDVFEDFKVVGKEEVMTIEYKKGSSLTWESAKKAMDALAEKGSDRIAFIHLQSIESDGEKKINTGKVKPWKNPKVKAVSNGTKWYTLYDLEEYITSRKYETD